MKKNKQNKNSIRWSFFRSISMTSILFMVLLFLGISVLFLKHSFQLEQKNAMQQLNYISGQFQYYLDATENHSKTILSGQTVQEYMTAYLAKKDSSQATIKVKQHILQIIQSTPFIHSVSLYDDTGYLLVSTEPNSSLLDLNIRPTDPVWQIGTKKHLVDKNKNVKVLSYIRPFYDIYSGQILGYIELAIPETQISAIYEEYNTSNELFLLDQNGIVQSSSGIPEQNKQYEYFESIQQRPNSQYLLAGDKLLFFTRFPSLNWYVLNQIPVITFVLPLLTIFCLSLLIAALVMVLCVFASHQIAKKVTYPLSYLASHIQTVKEGNWALIHEIPCNDEVASLLSSFNSMITTQTQLKADLIEAEKLKQHLSLSLLQQQVNPHFLYNTLDNICSLAELDEKETLIQLVMNLSSFYRSSLSNGKMKITIGQELEISRAYLEILRIRYFNKFDFTIDCPQELKQYDCIKLLLQPILENSIYHGIKGLERLGILTITVTEHEASICFTISDNGHGFAPEAYEKIHQENTDHFGIQSVQKRIQLYYGEHYGLSVESPRIGGCVIKLTIPKLEEASCH